MWASGLSIIVDIAERFLVGGGLEGDLDGGLGRVDARAHHLALRGEDLPGWQVADLAGAQPANAGVADAHPASERQGGAGLLAGHQDRLGAVALGFDPAVGEADGPALAALAVTDDVRGLEA